MRTLLLLGSQADLVRAAPIFGALREFGEDGLLAYTGHPGDLPPLEALFSELQVPEPACSLGIEPGSHAQQIVQAMQALEPLTAEMRPDWIVLVGETDAALTCSFVLSKLRAEVGFRIARLEAGSREGDWRVADEANRILMDHLADLLLAPSYEAFANLTREGVSKDRVAFVGSMLIDTLFSLLPRAIGLGYPGRFGLLRGGYVAAVLEHPATLGRPEALRAALEGIRGVAEEIPVALVLPPLGRARLEELGAAPLLETLCDPRPEGYTEVLSLVEGAGVILTDSAEMETMAQGMGIPCVSLRSRQARPGAARAQTARVAQGPPEAVAAAVREAWAEGRTRPGEHCPEGWDGRAAMRVVQSLLHFDPPGSPTESRRLTHTIRS
ncbi:MAG TPA: UDP-N-acetylglucosamine 2-epimerase [Longimicrobiaceae bacterium]|nr:UDP-N-acetylglucosamine 2-epimerase [Longimicrobiaceae bacterium]